MITEPQVTANAENDLRTTSNQSFDSNMLMGSIEFRVVRDGSTPRRMRINTTRCTLGNGEGCTVRLNDPVLRSMHAVLLRDSHRVLLRAYTVPIEVNGELTCETFLYLGDKFTLGSYNFELVQTPEFSVAPGLENLSGCVNSISVPSDDALLNLGAEATSSAGNDDFQASPLSTPKRPARLSFLGGRGYVSEAVQAMKLETPMAMTTADLGQRASQKAHAEQLRREIAAWRLREQEWKERDAQTRSQLADALNRFQQSHEQAAEASRSVQELRSKLAEVTKELQALSNESTSYQQQAQQRQERYLKAADAAGEARDNAIRQRDAAESKADQAIAVQEQLTQECNRLRAENEAAILHCEAARQELASAQAERDIAIAQQLELSQKRDEWNHHREIAQPQIIELTLRNEELQNKLQQAEDKARLAVEQLNENQAKLDAVNQEFCVASENLSIARSEAGAANSRIEELTAEVTRLQNDLVAERRTLSDTNLLHAASVAELKDEVTRLQAQCVAIRAETTTADQESIEQLTSKLATAERTYKDDRTSWEEEAVKLHQNIRQLTEDLASTTAQLTHKDSECDATQTELNSAYDRLTAVRRELAIRPTNEQWDELQKQLVETERQLAETEQQIAELRKEYETLVQQPPVQSFRSPENLEIGDSIATDLPARFATPIPEPANGNALPSHPTTSTSQYSHQDSVAEAVSSSLEPENVDHGWPIYQATHFASPTEHASLSTPEFEDDPEAISWDVADESVADRLSTYASHDEAKRTWNVPDDLPSTIKRPASERNTTKTPSGPSLGSPSSEAVSDVIEPVTKRPSQVPAQQNHTERSNRQTPSIAAERQTPVQPQVDFAAPRVEIMEQGNHPSMDEEPSIGSLAKQLIAQLNEGPQTGQANDSELAVSQSIGSWVSSSKRWQEPQDDEPNRTIVELDENIPDPASETESHWKSPSSSSWESSAEPLLADDVAFRGESTKSSWQGINVEPETDEDAVSTTYPPQVETTVNGFQIDAMNELEQASSNELQASRWATMQDHRDSNKTVSGEEDFTCMLSDLPSSVSHEVDEFENSESEAPYVNASNEYVDEVDNSDISSSSFSFESEVIERESESEATLTDASVEGGSNTSADSDDDSIEAYMNRLLQRVQGHSASPSSGASVTEKATKPTPVEPTTSEPESERRKEDTRQISQTVEVIDPNAPIVPRSQAPEDAGNLAAMRELANATANSAISQSVRGRAEKMKSRAIIDLFQAGVVIICAFAFYTCGLKIPSLKYVWFTASLLAAALSVFFVIDMLKKLAAAKVSYDDVDREGNDEHFPEEDQPRDFRNQR